MEYYTVYRIYTSYHMLRHLLTYLKNTEIETALNMKSINRSTILF